MSAAMESLFSKIKEFGITGEELEQLERLRAVAEAEEKLESVFRDSFESSAEQAATAQSITHTSSSITRMNYPVTHSTTIGTQPS